MNSFLQFLKSSLITAIVTFLFNLVLNRKKDTLSYITQERKNWRERIRELAEKIEMSRYNGSGNEDIKPYLVQLKMNINTYGKDCIMDISHDSHIWQSIERIQLVTSEEEFNNEKEMLLNFLSLMLKNDWERCKREVRGNTIRIWSLIFVLTTCLGLGVYYFIICNGKNVSVFISLTLVINIIGAAVFAFVFYVNRSKIGNKKVIGISREKRERRNEILALIAIICVAIGILFSETWIENLVMNDIKSNSYIDLKDNEIYLNINTGYFKQIQNNLEISVGHNIKIVKKLDVNKMTKISKVKKEIQDEIVDGIKNSFALYNVFIILLLLLNLAGWELLMGEFVLNKERYENKVFLMKERAEFSFAYELEKLSEMNQRLSETTDIRLIDLEYELLSELSIYWERERDKKDLNKKYLNDLESIKVCEEKIAEIRVCKKYLKRFRRIFKIRFRNRFFNGAKEKLLHKLNEQLDLITE